MNTTEAKEYDPVAKALHWFIAIAIFIMFATAMAMDDVSGDLRRFVFTTHKTTGVLILAFMILRVLWSNTHAAPGLPEKKMPKWQLLAARFVHDALYALALVTPIIGWALVSLDGNGIMLFGSVYISPLPYIDVFSKFDVARIFLSELHEILATILASLVVIHLGATFMHHFVERDDILMRISPVCLHDWLRKIRGK